MKLQGPFRSKVARRVFVLFLIAAMLPLTVLAWFTYGEVSRQLGQQTTQRLRQESKFIGTSVLERLLLLEAELALVADRLQGEDLGQTRPARNRAFSHVSINSGASAYRSAGLSSDELRRVQTAKPLLKVERGENDTASVRMLHSVDRDDTNARLVIGEVDPGYLWDLPIQETTAFCVLQGPVTLFCSDDFSESALDEVAAATRQRISGTLRWRTGGTDFVAGFWTLFLESNFAAPGWVIVLKEREDLALSNMRSFKAAFAPLIVTALLLVGFLSSVQIRRLTVPLELLKSATLRFAAQNFSQPVIVDSGDEFQELAESFNQMGTRIERQLNVLEVLSEIDRTILSTLDTRQILRILLTRSAELVRCEVVSVLAFDNDQEGSGRIDIRSTADDHRERRETVKLSETELARLAAADDYLLVAKDEFEYLSSQFAAGMQTCLVLPIRVEGRLHAVLNLATSTLEPPSPDEISVATHLADRASVGLTNAVWEEKLVHQAHYDGLTGLPNRTLLMDRLEQALNRGQRDGSGVAVLFLDLDRFKLVNDSLGHASGDALLRTAAERMTGRLRDSDTICRFGGDEFVLLLPDIRAANLVGAAEAISQSILASLSDPIVIDDEEVSVTASIGIALYPQDARNADDLLKNADAAMYHAKDSGRNRCQFYSADLNTALMKRLSLERELKKALDAGQLELHYQPRVDAVSEAVLGAEALLRWIHPELGFISPADFIPIAEETGLIVPIGEWVLKSACNQARRWYEADRPLKVAVNLSPRQFNYEGLVDSVEAALEESRLAASYLELEVTESCIMTDFEHTVRVLREFSTMGISIAVDDFGTGYSSLAYLARMPLDVLKVDQSFVRHLEPHTEIASIVRSIIDLAHSLDLKVVAEGVETREQLAFLREHRCQEIQGYLFSKPLTASDFNEFMLVSTSHSPAVEQRRAAG